MDGEIYFPRYIVPAGDGTVDDDTAAWIKAQNGQGPLRVIDVADLCERFGVTATLHDRDDNEVGRVFANGRHRLG